MRGPLAGVLAAVVLAAPGAAHGEPRIVERVVARVDGRPVLLSELRERALPLLAGQRAQPAWRRAQALRFAYRELMERRIEEELLATLASKHAVAVADAEVNDAITRLATTREESVHELFAAVRAAGWSVQLYRAEIARQLLDYKAVRAAARSSESNDHAGARERLLGEAKERACIERLVRF
jgi:hypothetical protein